MACEHPTGYTLNSKLNKFEDRPGKMMLELTLICQDCGAPFVFLGLPVGLAMSGATVSVDGTELRIAVAAPGSPGPLEQSFKEMRGPTN